MTPAQLTAITEALEKATPGKWTLETSFTSDEYQTPYHEIVSGPHTPQTQLSRFLATVECCADAEAICTLRNEVSALVAHVRALEAKLATCEQQRDEARLHDRVHYQQLQQVVPALVIQRDEARAFIATLTQERDAAYAKVASLDADLMRLVAQMTYIQGGDIPNTIEGARAALVLRCERAEARVKALEANNERLQAALTTCEKAEAYLVNQRWRAR